MTGVARDEESPDAEVDALIARAGGRRRPVLRWVLIGVALTVIGGWALVAGRSLGRDARLVRSPLLGKPAPAFDLPGLDGGRVTSRLQPGDILVVNFWASWCVPCQEEAPELQAFAERWEGRGVQLVGIVYNDRRGDAAGFRDRYGLTYPQALDPGGRAALDFGVFGIPETYVIDGRGIVMAKLIGAVSPGVLDDVVVTVRDGRTVSAENDRYRTGRSGS